MPHTHKIHLFIRKNCDFVCIQRNSLYICNHKTKQETNQTMFLTQDLKSREEIALYVSSTTYQCEDMEACRTYGRSPFLYPFPCKPHTNKT